MTNLMPQTLQLQPGDENVLKYLGVAVVLQWHDLPADVRASLLRQADAVGGLPLSADLQRSIRDLIDRLQA